MVAQVILVHFVMVRIHVGQFFDAGLIPSDHYTESAGLVSVKSSIGFFLPSGAASNSAGLP